MLKTAKKLQRDWFLSHEGAQRPLVARRNHFEARLIIFGYKVESEDVEAGSFGLCYEVRFSKQ